MKKIYFRKILQYDPTFGGQYSKYEGYQKIAIQALDPNIEQSQNEEMNIPGKSISRVYTSSLRRGVLTANRLFDSQNITLLDELKEIKFDLTRLLSEKEYIERGSDLVRERFIQAFIKDTLNEKRIETENRLMMLLKKIESLEKGEYLMISHSFIMKILQIYLHENSLFDKPGILKEKFDPNSKTFEFGKGFDISISEKNEFVVK